MMISFAALAQAVVTVSGSTVRAAQMGAYKMQGGLHDDRAYYKSSKDNYLYYTAGNGRWNIGPRLGSRNAWMFVTDSALLPHSITNTWAVHDGHEWRAGEKLTYAYTGTGNIWMKLHWSDTNAYVNDKATLV
jgi:hypothetical protein